MKTASKERIKQNQALGFDVDFFYALVFAFWFLAFFLFKFRQHDIFLWSRIEEPHNSNENWNKIAEMTVEPIIEKLEKWAIFRLKYQKLEKNGCSDFENRVKDDKKRI